LIIKFFLITFAVWQGADLIPSSRPIFDSVCLPRASCLSLALVDQHLNALSGTGRNSQKEALKVLFSLSKVAGSADAYSGFSRGEALPKETSVASEKFLTIRSEECQQNFRMVIHAERLDCDV
jgi:hypothetical protein